MILLDEPTSHLDINQQVEILSLLQRMNREGGLTILAVFHDLNLAAQFCDLMILMQKGKAYRVGKPEDVLTVDSIKSLRNPCSNQKTPCYRPASGFFADPERG